MTNGMDDKEIIKMYLETIEGTDSYKDLYGIGLALTKCIREGIESKKYNASMFFNLMIAHMLDVIINCGSNDFDIVKAAYMNRIELFLTELEKKS